MFRAFKNNLHHRVPERYISRAAAKSAAGNSTPNVTNAQHRAHRGFFVCEAWSHLDFMVGRAGQPQGWPGSFVTGSGIPVRLTTLRIPPLAGELFQLTTNEDALSWQPNLSSILTKSQYLSPSLLKSFASCAEQLPSLILLILMHASKKATCYRLSAYHTSSATCTTTCPRLLTKRANWDSFRNKSLSSCTALMRGAWLCCVYPFIRRNAHV
ncbi:hypothetical protein GBN32_00360 [Plesiomonas shigelloides]|nr:hypothetical protein GBN32_00360 [Plesiomonas shigelloides]